MILAVEPACDLPPISRVLKFDDFDRLCARLVNNLAAAETAKRTGGAGLPRQTDNARTLCRSDATPAAANSLDDWHDTATDPGGYHGEIELTPVGAVPVVELEG